MIKAKLIICGGRGFSDYELLKLIADNLLEKHDLSPDEVEVISGHCDGADKLGERYADEHSMKCAIFPAEWQKYGKCAGPIRNTQMIEYAFDAELPMVIAFMNERTRGTMDTVKKAEKKGFEVVKIAYS